jgi:hypothetical protein
MTTSKQQILNYRLKRYGMAVQTIPAGNGVTHYRFVRLASDVGDQFSEDGIYTATDFEEAETFARGWIAGRQAASEVIDHSDRAQAR